MKDHKLEAIVFTDIVGYTKKMEKLVIKNEFRKKIFIFNIENITGDTALDYLQYGIPEMTEYDLSQNLFITTQTAMEIYTRIAEAGYENAVIAQDKLRSL